MYRKRENLKRCFISNNISNFYYYFITNLYIMTLFDACALLFREKEIYYYLHYWWLEAPAVFSVAFV